MRRLGIKSVKRCGRRRVSKKLFQNFYEKLFKRCGPYFSNQIKFFSRKTFLFIFSPHNFVHASRASPSQAPRPCCIIADTKTVSIHTRPFCCFRASQLPPPTHSRVTAQRHPWKHIHASHRKHSRLLM